MPSVIDILADCRLFSAVPAKSFQRLATMARLAKFARARPFSAKTRSCPGVYVVGKGMVRVFKTGAGGKEHVLHMVEAGGTFAEVAAMGEFNVPASAQAVEATLCVLLPQPAFRKALEEDHPLCLGMLMGLSLWVKHLVGLLEDVVLRDAAGRIANYLLDAAGRRRRRGLAQPQTLHGQSSQSDQRDLFADISPPHRRGIDLAGREEPVRIVAPERLRSIAQGQLPGIVTAMFTVKICGVTRPEDAQRLPRRGRRHRAEFLSAQPAGDRCRSRARDHRCPAERNHQSRTVCQRGRPEEICGPTIP